MNTAQNYGEGDSCAKSNSKAPQVNQPTVNNTVARHTPVKSYFTLDVSTLTSSDGTGPSQFDVLTEALSYSRDKAIDQMRTHLLEFALS